MPASSCWLPLSAFLVAAEARSRPLHQLSSSPLRRRLPPRLGSEGQQVWPPRSPMTQPTRSGGGGVRRDLPAVRSIQFPRQAALARPIRRPPRRLRAVRLSSLLPPPRTTPRAPMHRSRSSASWSPCRRRLPPRLRAGGQQVWPPRSPMTQLPRACSGVALRVLLPAVRSLQLPLQAALARPTRRPPWRLRVVRWSSLLPPCRTLP